MLAGVHTGQVKWFNRRRGYGFIKIIQSRDNEEPENESFIGKDVFVHQSHIKPQKSSYRSLEENEYVELGLSVDDKNVTQAVNVTGILGGSLLCDVQHERPVRTSSLPEGESSSEGGEFALLSIISEEVAILETQDPVNHLHLRQTVRKYLYLQILIPVAEVMEIILLV